MTFPEESFDSLYRKILQLIPRATIEEDNEGQLIIYTNLTMLSKSKCESRGLPEGTIVDMDANAEGPK